MGFITDILKDIPVSANLRDKLQDLGENYETESIYWKKFQRRR